MKKNSSNTPVIIAVVIMLISFAVSYFMLIPNYRTTNEKLALAQQDLSTVQNQLDALQKTKADLDDLGPTVDQVLVAVPADVDAPDFITELEAMTAKYGTYLPTVQLSANANGNVDLAFSATGSFSDMTSLMKSVESDIRVMNIESMSVSSNKDKMTVSLQIEAYKR